MKNQKRLLKLHGDLSKLLKGLSSMSDYELYRKDKRIVSVELLLSQTINVLSVYLADNMGGKNDVKT